MNNEILISGLTIEDWIEIVNSIADLEDED